MASSTECPLFPKPRKGKGQSQKKIKNGTITPRKIPLFLPGLSFAQVTSGQNSQQRAARGRTTGPVQPEKQLSLRSPSDQEPFLVASIYAPPGPNYRNLGADLDGIFNIFKSAFLAGDYNAKHTSWGCNYSDPRDRLPSQQLTDEILNAHASASRPFYHTEQPYVQGELKELFKERNKARKTWQHTRHPQHKTELNRLQNAIKRKIYHYRQQAWEDNLSTLNAEDNSLWGIAKAFRKKTSPISALNGPTGIALSDTNKTEILSYVLKTAVVIPILKPDKNSALAESYRPISLLPVLSKLAEKVILARLNDHLERENILIPEQHGFRPRLSTSHQLLRVVEFIKEGNNKARPRSSLIFKSL
ncbi:uncharacterized protein TNCV_1669751 [Trichonephila clavipes]|nr:uncharacterized protein TNCV_1669751 [Trichonephila clavipes]